MHDLTPEQLHFARLCFGKFEIKIPNFSGIKKDDKFYANLKHGGEMVLVDVIARGTVYMLECWTEKGKPRTVPVVEVWSFDHGEIIINANELREKV